MGECYSGVVLPNNLPASALVSTAGDGTITIACTEEVTAANADLLFVISKSTSIKNNLALNNSSLVYADSNFAYQDATNANRTLSTSANTTVVGPNIDLARTMSSNGQDVTAAKIAPGDLVRHFLTASNRSAANVSAAYDGFVVESVPLGITVLDSDGSVVGDGATTASGETSTADNASAASMAAGARSTRVSLQKTSKQRFVKAGKSAVYKIVLKNKGSFALLDAHVCDRLPKGMVLVGAKKSKVIKGNVCWRVDYLPAGASRTFVLKARAVKNAKGNITN